ncbi:MAG: LysR substrate-binding domain-containing protein, partial [Polaromonas sp.]|nr:LysR substrate-binding domain-containing protein [Polaromonas sp.]
VTPEILAAMPLLQQSTRPEAWKQWFDAQGVAAPQAMSGPRYELFSMQAAAATCGLGVALMPTLLIEAELASGALVLASSGVQHGRRSYYLIQPETPERPALAVFREWLMGQLPERGI